MVKKFSEYLTAYLLWFILLLLGVILFVLSRSLIQSLLGAYYVDEKIQTVWVARFVDPVTSVFLGLLWLILMVFSEDRLRHSVRRGDLLPQFARLAGPLLIFLFLLDLSLFFILGMTSLDFLRLSFQVVELLGGIGLTYYGRRFKKRGVNLEDQENFS